MPIGSLHTCFLILIIRAKTPYENENHFILFLNKKALDSKQLTCIVKIIGKS